MSTEQDSTISNALEFDIGSDHIIIQRRYEAAGAVNDLFIAIWFLIGSIFFFYEALTYDGTWLFVLGSAQLMIKPMIKLAGLIHMGRIHPRLKRRRAAKKAANGSN